MTAVLAYGAISALGEGEAAASPSPLGEPATSRVRADDELSGAGLSRPFCARARDVDGASRDRAAVLLERALAQCSAALDEARPGWRRERVGLALGTSSGGMRVLEGADSARAAGTGGTYLGPVLAAARPELTFAPFSLVLGACASGTLAIGLGHAWLETGACDVVLAGGFDAVSVFVAAGFEALRATSATGSPRPFRRDRDGLALGEGAAIVALARDEGRGRALGYVRGFAASCDAVHLTAPDVSGLGLARAVSEALERSQVHVSDVALVSAHGTATNANDAAEAKALAAAGLARAPLTALKGVTGHTLGAAGALETIAALIALRLGVVPATVGVGAAEGEVCLHDETARLAGDAATPLVALKVSSAFGGANAALVLSDTGPSARGAEPRAVYVTPAAVLSEIACGRAAVDEAIRPSVLAVATGVPEDRLARMDDLVRLCLASVARLAAGRAFEEGTGIIVGHGLATFETNATFLRRLREAGARRVLPRSFPYTTPNASAGECAIAFGLRGPAFAVGGGPHGGIEALAVAHALVASGVAPAMLVVAVDEAGSVTQEAFGGVSRGAVALLVTAEPRPGRARLEATVTLRPAAPEPEGAEPEGWSAHEALVPLGEAGNGASSIEVTTRGMIAKASFFWL